MIRAENVTFDYESMDEEGNVESRKRAVNHVNLEIQSGQFIAVLGHNGSGKSTFAKHINALLTPTEGTLWVEGMNTRDESELWNIRQNAGMVFQNPDNQIIGTIVEEDVGFGPENLGVPTDEIWQRVEESLKAVGMYKYRKHCLVDRSSVWQLQASWLCILAVSCWMSRPLCWTPTAERVS